LVRNAQENYYKLYFAFNFLTEAESNKTLATQETKTCND